jgi:hypothetical protein
MKRHERPYGCTFSTCNKAFGSKNDWKRHENSQHFQSEMWRCDECTSVFHLAGHFRDHLIETHKINDDKTIVQKTSDQRIGPNFQGHFWCGFCKKVINLTDKGVDAWTERFNHVDNHFMGRNGSAKLSIMSWVHADAETSDAMEVCDDSMPTSGASDSSPKSDSSGDESTTPAQKRSRDTSSDEVEQPSAKRLKEGTEAKYERRVECVSHNASTGF